MAPERQAFLRPVNACTRVQHAQIVVMWAVLAGLRQVRGVGSG